MGDPTPPAPAPDGDAPRRPARRPRYRGTHPRAYAERYKELDPERFPEAVAHVRARGRTPAGGHVPVLLDEALAALAVAPGDVVADLTLGAGGHAREVLRRLGGRGRLLGFDHDVATLEATRARLAREGLADVATFHAVHHAALPQVLAAEGLDGVDAALADLGVSSMQLDDPARGFSFRADGPLDMRMDRRRGRTAADVVAGATEAELVGALGELADEPRAAAVAAAIVRARAAAPIATTGRLLEVVLGAHGLTPATWKARRRADPDAPHPAARTFQALRILVNDELAGLERLLAVVPWCLRPGGRLVVVSFHSGEDRRVKHAFRAGLEAGLFDAVSDEVVRPSPREVAGNPRAASAKLRIARRARTG